MSATSAADILARLDRIAEQIDSLAAASEHSLRRYLTVSSAAAYCDLSEESIRRMIASRKLTAHRPVRGRVLVDRQELDAVIRSSTGRQKGGRGQTRRL